jgi:hypothetical protein
VLERIQAQHLQFSRRASKDAYWLSGARLDAVTEFVKILREQVIGSVGLLDQPLIPPNRNGRQPDEE